MGDARAALFAAQEAHLLNGSNVIFEGDTVSMCKAINDPLECPDWRISSLAEDSCLLFHLHP